MEAITSLKEQYPELAAKHWRVNQRGWANLVLVVDEELIFRLPRTDAARRALELERQVLPRLRERCAAAVPDFLYASEPDSQLTYVGYRMIRGTFLTSDVFARVEKVALARELGAFLTELHGLSAELPQEGGKWERFYDRIEREVFPLLTVDKQRWTRELFERFLGDPANFAYTPCPIHGDLSSDHLLFDEQAGRLAGVIDFGDLELGDPAYDFVGLHLEYGEAFVEQVLAFYGGPVDARFRSRIREFYAKRTAFHGILHGLEIGDEEQVQRSLLDL